MAFEAIRLDPSHMVTLEIPPGRLEVSSADGIALIADNARWRDADKLAHQGIHFAAAPKADS
jgi:hypothetical protein